MLVPTTARIIVTDFVRPAKRLRIGAVTYLNARPLTYALPQLAPTSEIVVDLPSRLAEGLVAGALDVAMVPSIEHFRLPGSRVVSDACVACDGEVRSVKLFSRVPIGRIRSLALDVGSRTSVSLARILLGDRFGVEPRVEPLPIDAPAGGWTTDAAVLIGDRGMLEPAERFEVVWDLGREWRDWTGLPFVFALWVARPEAEIDGLGELFSRARDEGILRFEEIARQSAPQVGLPEAECLAYLRDHLHFRLGDDERRGLTLFYELAARRGLAPEGVTFA